MSWRGAIYQSHMTVNDMGLFGNDILDELFGGIFDTKKQKKYLMIIGRMETFRNTIDI